MSVEPKAKRQSQTTEHLSQTTEEISKLHDVIDNLTDRLSTVLRSDVPEKALQSEMSDLVILACSIREFGFSVKAARAKIESILDRLEL